MSLIFGCANDEKLTENFVAVLESNAPSILTRVNLKTEKFENAA